MDAEDTDELVGVGVGVKLLMVIKILCDFDHH